MTTLFALKVLRNLGSSPLSLVTVLFASAGSSLIKANLFDFMNGSISQPKFCAFWIMDSGPSSRVMNTQFSSLDSPFIKNWSPNVVFPVPHEPNMATVWPSGRPPFNISSRPFIPVLTTILTPHDIISRFETTRPPLELIMIGNFAILLRSI